MLGMAGCGQDFAANADLAQELAALRERDDNVAVLCYLNVVIAWFRPPFHERDGWRLNIKHQQGNAFAFQFFGKAGVVDMIVGGERVADFVQRHPHLPEIRLHHAERSRPADIDQQARSACADYPVVG